MARKNKDIEVEIQETSRDSETFTELEVLVKNKVIGTVSQEEQDQAKVIYKSGKTANARSIEEGVQMVIAKYNLYDQ